MDINRLTIIGRATSKPEVRALQNGQSVTEFSVATNHAWYDSNKEKQEQAEFHNIVAWGKLAEICGQYVDKGSRVYVEGRVQTDSWLVGDVKKYKTKVIANNVIMLDKKSVEQNTPVQDDDYDVGNIPF